MTKGHDVKIHTGSIWSVFKPISLKYHHLEKYRERHPEFVNLMTRSIYVDDITYGASNEEAAFELYSKSKKVLAEGGFNFRKFVSNSQSL